MSVSKPKGDVTRNAVVVATRVIADATEKLKAIITTGPDQVMMTKGQVDDSIAKGNSDLAAHIAQTEGIDNDLLNKMFARGQGRGKV